MPHVEEIATRPCSSHVGVEIIGIDVSESLGDTIIGRIRQLLHERGVVLFRGRLG